MSDFENRVTDALSGGAEAAPGPHGLVLGARQRSRTRRRRRLGSFVVVVVSVVLLPIGIVASRHDPGGPSAARDRGSATATTNLPDGWQTVTAGGTSVDVPPDWREATGCGDDVPAPDYGPASDLACRERPGLSFYASATFDPASGPGLARCEGSWCGYAGAGTQTAFVRGVDREVGERILDSVRPSDDQWHTVTYEGRPSAESGDGRVSVDVPPGWERIDTSGCTPAPIMFGLTNRVDACPPAGTVALVPAGNFDPFSMPGLIADGGTWGGYAYAGQFAVSTNGLDEETARRILGSARTFGDPSPSLETWSTLELDDGITAQVPDDGSVQVQVPAGYPDCARDRSAAEQRGSEWRASLCRDRVVIVTAPTQAMADVVASTVRGY